MITKWYLTSIAWMLKNLLPFSCARRSSTRRACSTTRPRCRTSSSSTTTNDRPGGQRSRRVITSPEVQILCQLHKNCSGKVVENALNVFFKCAIFSKMLPISTILNRWRHSVCLSSKYTKKYHRNCVSCRMEKWELIILSSVILSSLLKSRKNEEVRNKVKPLNL